MRLSIVIDSATTDEVRALMAAYARTAPDNVPLWDHGRKIAVGCNGPDHWSAATPPIPRADAEALLRSFVADLDGSAAKARDAS